MPLERFACCLASFVTRTGESVESSLAYWAQEEAWGLLTVPQGQGLQLSPCLAAELVLLKKTWACLASYETVSWKSLGTTLTREYSIIIHCSFVFINFWYITNISDLARLGEEIKSSLHLCLDSQIINTTVFLGVVCSGRWQQKPCSEELHKAWACVCTASCFKGSYEGWV